MDSTIQLLPNAAISAVYERLRQANPEPQGELYWTNTYTLLVAVVLSAQATDAGVNKATKKLFEYADTPEKMLALGEEKVKDAIRTINLYPTKAKRIIALSSLLIEKYGSTVPRSREDLESLPGVGRKTANVVLNMGFGEPAIAVDTHILRTAPRIGLSQGTTPLEVEQDLLRVTPQEFLLNAHHWILLHGRYVCKARKPSCDSCILADICLKNGISLHGI
ncbi:MAG: endonuclease III [Treponema sp.]